jgi:probable F420-dependent oxidoreductase
VKHGLAIFATDEGLAPTELARLAEERGFESLFVPDHTHIPVSRDSAAPRGGELPREYSRMLDPFVALTAAACATTKLRVGTGLCLVVERDPIVTAKSVATLDLLSGGRFLFGVGAGWNQEEMRNHGTDPSRRFALMRERVEAMKRIWTEDEPAFAGEFVSFEPIWSWPKPVQKPHPPVMIGGNGPRVIERVLAYGDEWLPEPEDGLVDRIRNLRGAARAAGREDVPVTVYGARLDDVEMYEAAGVHRCVHWLPPHDGERTARRIHEIADGLGL